MFNTRCVQAWMLALVGVAAGLPTQAAVDIRAPCPSVPSGGASNDVKAFGAKGDGTTDDTAAIQSAIDATGAGGLVVVPSGTYVVSVGQGNGKGLALKSDMQFVLSNGATLKALPSDDANSAMLRAWKVTNLKIFGGTLIGERLDHRGTTGEWGMGVDIRDSSSVSIVGTVARDFWGDGFYLGGQTNSDILLCRVTADSNRRNGVSIVAADGVLINRSTFVNTAGTSPQGGVDIEPNEAGIAENIVLANSLVRGNRGPGVSIVGCKGCNVKVRNNVVLENHILDNGGDGVLLRYDDHRVTGNVIENSGGNGINAWNTARSTITDNTIRHSGQTGIQLEDARDGHIQNNIFDANPKMIYVRRGTNANQIDGNRCSGGGAVTYQPGVADGNHWGVNRGCGPR